MNVFPDFVISDTELEVVATNLSVPAVRKYFQMLAYKAGTTIVLANKPSDVTLEEFHTSVEHYKGQLSVLETLLSIPVKPQV